MSFISYKGYYSSERINHHQHKEYELHVYTSGNGKTNIDGKEYEVEQGMLVIMPPNIMHGSISYDNLGYYAIKGKCDELLHIDTPIIFKDSEFNDGLNLLQMIFANRYSGQEYFNALCKAFVNFALKNVKALSPLEKAVNKIKNQMSINLQDSSFDVTALLNDSGYAEDYIRASFRKLVGKTPVEFLAELRINHAKTLINVYQHSTPLIDIAISCGFDDYIYFSRKFKQIVGISPKDYKTAIIKSNEQN